jgi:hypothetical protein
VVDEAIKRQLEGLWPDVTGPFGEILPSGVLLYRFEDDWSVTGPLRRRGVDLGQGPTCPPIEELIDEVAGDAIRADWDEIEPLDGHRRFETEGVVLTLAEATTPLLIGSRPSLRISFDQPWPEDAGPPVETSEMFQNLVRRLLSLGGEPLRLGKIITLDPQDGARSDVIRELVELPSLESLVDKFEELGFVPPEVPGAPWISKSSSKAYTIYAEVLKRGDRASVVMERRRHLT